MSDRTGTYFSVAICYLIRAKVISHREAILLAVMDKFASESECRYNPTTEELAQRCGVSPRHILRMIASLTEKRILDTDEEEVP